MMNLNQQKDIKRDEKRGSVNQTQTEKEWKKIKQGDTEYDSK